MGQNFNLNLILSKSKKTNGIWDWIGHKLSEI